MRIETLKPIPANIDQVLQPFAPEESVSYFSHVFGITCEPALIFTRITVDQTAINVVMNLVGTPSRTLGFALAPAITKATKGFFEELRRECEAACRSAEM